MDIELQLDRFLLRFLEEFGYDFTGYSPRSIQRRIIRIMTLFKVSDLDDLLSKMLKQPSLVGSFVQQVTVPWTTMFRDPAFFLALRQQVIPYLSTYPLIRVWVAGCSTGEEAYSLAILLYEAGLMERSLIYVTDLNPVSVDCASQAGFLLRTWGSSQKIMSVRVELGNCRRIIHRTKIAFGSMMNFGPEWCSLPIT